MAHKLYVITESRAQTRDHAPVRPVVDLGKRWKTPLIGNRVSQISHTPAQKSYGNVAPKNQVRFWTEREAQQAGYRRAANDHYGAGTGVAQTATHAGALGEKFQQLPVFSAKYPPAHTRERARKSLPGAGLRAGEGG